MDILLLVYSYIKSFISISQNENMTEEFDYGGGKQQGHTKGPDQPGTHYPAHTVGLYYSSTHPLFYPSSSHDVILQQAATLSYITPHSPGQTAQR